MSNPTGPPLVAMTPTQGVQPVHSTGDVSASPAGAPDAGGSGPALDELDAAVEDALHIGRY